MRTPSVFAVSVPSANATQWVNVVHLAGMHVAPEGTQWALHFRLDAGGELGYPLTFTTEAEALAAAEVWAQRIEDAR